MKVKLSLIGEQIPHDNSMELPSLNHEFSEGNNDILDANDSKGPPNKQIHN